MQPWWWWWWCGVEKENWNILISMLRLPWYQCVSILYRNVYILLGGRFEEFHAKLVGQLLATLERDHSLVLHVALVADQDDLCVVPGIGFNLGNPDEGDWKVTIDTWQGRKTSFPPFCTTSLPILYRIEAFLVGDVIHQNETHCTAIVCCRDCAISLLSGSIL